MTVLRSIDIFCRMEMSLNMGLSDIFLMIKWGLWVLAKKITEVKCHSIISMVHVINMNYCYWCLDHLTEVMFVRFLHCKVLPLTATYVTFWKEVTMCSPLKWWGVMLHLLGKEFFCTIDLSLLSQLSSQSFIYFIVWLIIQYYFIDCPNCIWALRTHWVGSCVPSACSHWFVFWMLPYFLVL